MDVAPARSCLGFAKVRQPLRSLGRALGSVRERRQRRPEVSVQGDLSRAMFPMSIDIDVHELGAFGEDWGLAEVETEVEERADDEDQVSLT
jgi:hypothetical protein